MSYFLTLRGPIGESWGQRCRRVYSWRYRLAHHGHPERPIMVILNAVKDLKWLSGEILRCAQNDGGSLPH